MKSFTIKIGQFDVDYGDQHYRRTDGGNTIPTAAASVKVDSATGELNKYPAVHQDYKNYPNTNILNGGKFYGTMSEASIAF